MISFPLITRVCALIALIIAANAAPADLPSNASGAPQKRSSASAAPEWCRGVWTDPDFFPIAVWLQAPANAERYRKAGINTYVGLWRGPTEEQLATLKSAGMLLICSQNQMALRQSADSPIIGWMHGDEPDNAQSLGQGKGYGPPIAPEKIVENYRQLQEQDATRPVLLNLGQGVAWDKWHGRGVRSNHPEDYPKYIEGSDIVSFDIYPAVHDHPDVAGKLWLLAYGVERLGRWADRKKMVWNCLECTHIGNPDTKPTPAEVRAEAWMSLIHGSRGLIYFVHQFKPVFREAALLDDEAMLGAVTKLNAQIRGLAPVLNSPTIQGKASVRSNNAEVPVAIMVKEHGGSVYVFGVAMRNGSTEATVHLDDVKPGQQVEVLDERRQLRLSNKSDFQDSFGPYAVHLYRIAGRK